MVFQSSVFKQLSAMFSVKSIETPGVETMPILWPLVYKQCLIGSMVRHYPLMYGYHTLPNMLKHIPERMERHTLGHGVGPLVHGCININFHWLWI